MADPSPIEIDGFRSVSSRPRLQTLVEVLLIVAVFALHGAWPVPDVNEAYYIGKAVHFWNPDWIPDDPFLESADSHWFFYVTCGWPSLMLSPAALAWCGRIVTWALLAWGWHRLSTTVIPKRWIAIVTAAAFATLLEDFHFAGEWVIGGFEGKGLSYACVFFGLAEAARRRWRNAWILLGLASAFHVLVGGWSVVSLGFAWLWLTVFCKERTPLLEMLIGLGVGGAIALLGVVPGLMLTGGVDPEIAERAHNYTVFYRLTHHLLPTRMPWPFPSRFGLLIVFWAATCLAWRSPRANTLVQAYAAGALLIALCGLGIIGWFLGVTDNQTAAAGLLRFYWFRLSDVAVPMGVALGLPMLFYAIRDDFKRAASGDDDAAAWAWPTGATMCALAALALLARMWMFTPRGRQLVTPEAADVIAWSVCALPAAMLLIAAWRLRRCFCPSPAPRLLSVLAMGAVAMPLVVAPTADVVHYAMLRVTQTTPRSEVPPPRHQQWLDVCDWIANSGEIPDDARFLSPRTAATFKWRTGHSDAGNGKEFPQDAASIIDWSTRMYRFHEWRGVDGNLPPNVPLSWRLWGMRPNTIRNLATEYDFQYVLTSRWPPLPSTDPIYENKVYAVYAVEDLVDGAGRKTPSARETISGPTFESAVENR